MTTHLHGRADRYDSVGTNERRSGVLCGTRFARRRLAVVGLGVAMMLPIAVPAASAATVSGVSTVRAGMVVRASVAGRCYSKEATIKGKSVIVDCGRASVKLHYKGKTYIFKSGECLRSAGSLVLSLGTSMVNNANGNGGFTEFSITLLPAPASGTAQITADDGKLHLVAFSATGSKIAVTGSFKGTNDASKGTPFSGSWNCGGAIYNF
ncbi:MAG TPA: hypothetical protein VIJ86_09755 [Acidimicrobiales bacterium]